MGANSKIEWTSHTFNPWIGCTRVSRGCVNCYAEDMMADRYGRVQWGPKGARSRTSEGYRRQPYSWNRAAMKAGRRASVFCASLSDVMDDHPSILPEWRAELWLTIADTQSLDWLLLTKRPENWPFLLPVAEPREPFRNVRLGVTIEDQEAFEERAAILQFAADLGWPTFVSYEPALGPVDWTPAFEGRAIHWLISGGESGREARPSHPDWHRTARDICARYGVPYLFKQWGELVPEGQIPSGQYRGYRVYNTPVKDSMFEQHHGLTYARVGKARAGRLLDGVEHSGMPHAHEPSGQP